MGYYYEEDPLISHVDNIILGINQYWNRFKQSNGTKTSDTIVTSLCNFRGRWPEKQTR